MTINEYVQSRQNKGENVSYSSIAELVPCTPAYISMVANGKRRPSYFIARRIEQATNGEVKRTNWYPQDE